MDDLDGAERRTLMDSAQMFSPEPRDPRWMCLLSAMMALLADINPWRVKEARWN